MTNLSDAADILKRAKQQQVQTSVKPVVVTSMAQKDKSNTIISGDVYSLKARSGKVVKMTGDDEVMHPGGTVISE